MAAGRGTWLGRLTSTAGIHTNARPRSPGQPAGHKTAQAVSVPVTSQVTGQWPASVVLCGSLCGCSSVVEHHVANVRVESSNLFTRSRFPAMARPTTTWARTPTGAIRHRGVARFARRGEEARRVSLAPPFLACLLLGPDSACEFAVCAVERRGARAGVSPKALGQSRGGCPGIGGCCQAAGWA